MFHISLTVALSTFILFLMLSNASELAELATTQRLLDQLDLARTVAAQSDPNNRRRFLFDYRKANEDLNTMRAATQPSRAQALDYASCVDDLTADRLSQIYENSPTAAIWAKPLSNVSIASWKKSRLTCHTKSSSWQRN